jgi:hypothetical protein
MNEKEPWELTDQVLAILGIIAISITSMFWIATDAKDVVVAAVSGLIGYIGGKNSKG